MFKERALHIILFCFLVIVTTAVMQYQNPAASIFDGGYIIAVLLTIFIRDDHYTRIFGFSGITLLFISMFYPQDEFTFKQVLLQRFFSAAIILMTMVLVLYLKRLYRSLESEENQMNALFEYATEGIILVNQKGEIVLMNPEGLRLFGYEKEAILGSRIERLIPMRYHEHHHDYRDNFMQYPSNRRMGHGRDLYAIRKDGVEFPVEVSLSHYRQKEGAFVIAFVIDISQRKKAEQEMRQQQQALEKITQDITKLNTQLEYKVEERTLILKDALNKLEESQKELEESLSKEKELNEIKSRFVSMASHEFRTPLSTVLSSAALIARYRKETEQEQRDKHILRIKNSVNHLNDLLEDFLSVGRLEEGRVLVQPTLIDIPEWMKDVKEEIKASLKVGQRLQLQHEGATYFCSDKRLLKHILLNLLGNAIKFSEPNTIVYAKVEVGDRIRLQVRDEGIGIAQEDQQHLFETFFRGKNATNIQGTGLGLHIVHRYVQLLEGEISLESELDRGTCFTVEIPPCPEA
jgi:PAS domain S-box-containing protein